MESKEKNVLNIEWILPESNCNDLFTKNLGCDMYQKFTKVFCGESVLKFKKSGRLLDLIDKN
jgi:hypothetical protein